MTPEPDTIAAIATPPGRGGVGMVRVSGSHTVAIGQAIFGPLPPPRRASFRSFKDEQGEVLDEGLVLYFSAPHSFTGEDVVELHGHGGPVVMDLLLKRALALGARLARPGEFSERAFLNNKLDLAQAEAIADLIESHTEQAARSAMRSLQGAFCDEIHRLVDGLVELRTYVEAALDFPDEEIDFLADTKALEHLQDLRGRLEESFSKAQQGTLLREGMRLVIAGRPNAGKSSLLNRLAGHDAAIVSHIPGTTRDVMHQEIALDGMPVRVIDTAGLRHSQDPIEEEGIRRAWQAIEAADLILLLIDAGEGYGAPDQAIEQNLPSQVPVLRVWNKMDLSQKPSGEHPDGVYISAKTGAGLEALRDKLKTHMGFQAKMEGVYTARRRHLEALEEARRALLLAETQLEQRQAGELMAEELRLAQRALGEITGEFTTDDLLGRIFSSFCIGK